MTDGTIPTPGLLTAVKYIASNGKPKAALVVANSDLIEEGTSLGTLQPGWVHLAVFSPTGKIYRRTDVPFRAVAATFADNADTPADKLTNVWDVA